MAGIDHAASQLAATAERIELGRIDLTDAAQTKKAIDAAAAHFGAIDALINLAEGITYYDMPPEYGVREYRYTIVNDEPVLDDPRTRRIVEIVE